MLLVTVSELCISGKVKNGYSDDLETSLLTSRTPFAKHQRVWIVRRVLILMLIICYRFITRGQAQGTGGGSCWTSVMCSVPGTPTDKMWAFKVIVWCANSNNDLIWSHLKRESFLVARSSPGYLWDWWKTLWLLKIAAIACRSKGCSLFLTMGSLLLLAAQSGTEVVRGGQDIPLESPVRFTS